ncbi:DUF1223 domain-containing protein [Alteromonas sp. a30]|uniref:DUF1223 domain-containing protein n=1 Tax=Alteromonas sp. a30 TaxID=2730917 RepID=UPI002281067C|nr:DUF1223 domain-containing protein [Alteromonas sp. a30]MCY7294030.1 DUF1223 domain-containing protein [Alteromonas sp. a30]
MKQIHPDVWSYLQDILEWEKIVKSISSYFSFFLCVFSAQVIASSAQMTSENAPTFYAQSGQDRVQIIELFSSEGCHSCPPADKWLSQYTHDPDLWQKYVPLAFHVDYWDYIGWKDRFAKQRFSQRQYQYERRGATGQVYTPQFVVNGKEWRGWFRHRIDKSVTLPKVKDTPGQLTFKVKEQTIFAEFNKPKSESNYVVLHVALLASDIRSHITRGENKRKTLEHDFVVLNHKSYRALDNDLTFEGSAPDIPNIAKEAGKLAWAAWIEENGVPVQATGGWINSL